TRAAVCHLHDPELLPVGLLLKLRGRRVVYDVHEDYPQQVLSKHYLPRALRRPLAALLGRFEGAAARRLDAVVAATDHIAMRFGASTTVVRNYPALPGALPRRPRDHGRGLRVVHLAGTLTEDRGITSLVRALGLLDDSFELVLAGRFVPADYGRRLAALPGWSRVRHVPPVPHELVWDVYAGCDAGVVCLLPLPRYRVSLPVKLFEFMAAGLPVVASDFPLFRDIVERAGCGLCVDPESPEQIAAALRRLAAGPAAATAMGAAGRRAAAACYGWNAEADVLLGLYRRLLPPRRAPLARANARPTAALANEVSGV
ncbi:glycosyltransferase family 4 protein, partial [candidate division WOR-3 bacterium]|nr:glycosyltransferase family 4 protein [candidate division WOR-3 bacterium]